MFDTVPTLDCGGRPLRLDRPRVMGIVNVTPDSFSDGGDHFDAAAAVAHGLRLAEEGAGILDVGGESARPGSACRGRRACRSCSASASSPPARCRATACSARSRRT